MDEKELELRRSMIRKKLDEYTEEELLLHLQNCDSWLSRKASRRTIYGLTQGEEELIEQVKNHRLKVLDRLPIK